MPKRISFGQGLSSILFWSIVSAAFIGPGTVTIAARAGADFRMQLLWALIFSVLATMSLQEAAARITIASGKSLGEIVAMQFSNTLGKRLRWFLFLAVAFGCGAYQAGNLLGALAGIGLVADLPSAVGTLLLGLVCFGFLWMGHFKRIARMLGMVVALMGVVFVSVAIQGGVGIQEFVMGTFQPSMPVGSSVLVIGLVGTTIVPYNLFLASGITQGQNIREMRLGLIPAVLIGGIISIAIMMVGAEITGNFSFLALANALGDKLGNSAAGFFGFGLFAAGLSSSVTAPLAAAITGQALLGNRKDAAWRVQGRKFRTIWGIVLGIGLLFGFINVQPIPAIILAQAINGVLLPIVTIFLFVAVNDQKLLGSEYANGTSANGFMLLIVGVTSFLGLNNIWKAIQRGFGIELAQDGFLLFAFAGISFLVVLVVFVKVLMFR